MENRKFHVLHISFRFMWLAIWVGLIVVMTWGVAGLPSLAGIIDPVTGLWQKREWSQLRNRELRLPGLKAPVTVTWDDHFVPHIRAESLADVYRVQGFVHASQRLFQMDMQTRVGSARLAEMLGARAIKADEFFIRMGVRHGLRVATHNILSDPITREAAEAYVAGVNDFLDLSQGQLLPPEYALLGALPARWEPWRVAALLQTMAFSLSGRNFDLKLSEYAQKLGEERVLSLFPPWLEVGFEAYFATGPGGYSEKFRPLKFISSRKKFPTLIHSEAVNGSNNWAVAGKKSTTGAVIFSNDTHLDLNLPVLYFEQSLSAPGLEVYGAGIPAAPGVILGFNRRVAWGVTNGTTDVMDWFEVQRNQPGLQWREEPEKIEVKGGAAVDVPLRWNEYGVVFDDQEDANLLLSWTAHAPGNELKTFLLLNRAQNFVECERALESFRVPIQNFLCTDAERIGILHRGRVPQREWGAGRLIHDGRQRELFWHKDIPWADLPSVRDPQAGFVFSANQRPVPDDYRYWLSWDYEESFRGQEIRRELSSTDKLSPEAMLDLLHADRNPLAAQAVPMMLESVSGQEHAKGKWAKDLLSQWDFRDGVDRVEPTVFWRWWRSLAEVQWQDELGEKSEGRWPRDGLLLKWLLYPESAKVKKSMPEAVKMAFVMTLEGLESDFGSDVNAWKWRQTRPVIFRHLGKIPGFGRILEASGSKYTISAIQKYHGPTWRLVVAHGEHPRAWSQLAGGNSGDPFSPNYDNEIRDWSQGKLKEVRFLQDLAPHTRATWRFSP